MKKDKAQNAHFWSNGEKILCCYLCSVFCPFSKKGFIHFQKYELWGVFFFSKIFIFGFEELFCTLLFILEYGYFFRRYSFQKYQSSDLIKPNYLSIWSNDLKIKEVKFKTFYSNISKPFHQQDSNLCLCYRLMTTTNSIRFLIYSNYCQHVSDLCFIHLS